MSIVVAVFDRLLDQWWHFPSYLYSYDFVWCGNRTYSSQHVPWVGFNLGTLGNCDPEIQVNPNARMWACRQCSWQRRSWATISVFSANLTLVSSAYSSGRSGCVAEIADVFHRIANGFREPSLMSRVCHYMETFSLWVGMQQNQWNSSQQIGCPIYSSHEMVKSHECWPS